MKKSESKKETLNIRGNSFRKESFKPFDLEACEIQRVVSMIGEVGKIANSLVEEGKTYDVSLVNSSPLLHIEGLLRFQLIKQNSEERFGIDLEWLIEPSDFRHMKGHVEHNVACNKISFLFEFLAQIVTLSYYPEFIDEYELEKIKINLQALSFLVENQINATVKSKDVGFKIFIRAVWEKMGSEESASAQKVWDKALYVLRLKENEGEIEMNVTLPKRYINSTQKKEVKTTFTVRLIDENEEEKEKIEVIYPKSIKKMGLAKEKIEVIYPKNIKKMGLAKEKAKSFSAFKGKWTNLKEGFIKNKIK